MKLPLKLITAAVTLAVALAEVPSPTVTSVNTIGSIATADLYSKIEISLLSTDSENPDSILSSHGTSDDQNIDIHTTSNDLNLLLTYPKSFISSFIDISTIEASIGSQKDSTVANTSPTLQLESSIEYRPSTSLYQNTKDGYSSLQWESAGFSASSFYSVETSVSTPATTGLSISSIEPFRTSSVSSMSTIARSVIEQITSGSQSPVSSPGMIITMSSQTFAPSQSDSLPASDTTANLVTTPTSTDTNALTYKSSNFVATPQTQSSKVESLNHETEFTVLNFSSNATPTMRSTSSSYVGFADGQLVTDTQMSGDMRSSISIMPTDISASSIQVLEVWATSSSFVVQPLTHSRSQSEI